MGITVVRAMARHRWRHSQYVGLTRVEAAALQAEGGPGAPEAGEGAAAERRSEEVVRMAQEGALLPARPWRPSGVVRGTGGERSVGVA